jgi:hypothetical protein
MTILGMTRREYSLKEFSIFLNGSQIFFKVGRWFEPKQHKQVYYQNDDTADGGINKSMNINVVFRIEQIREIKACCKGRNGSQDNKQGVSGEGLHIQFFPDEKTFGNIE